METTSRAEKEKPDETLTTGRRVLELTRDTMREEKSDENI